MKVIPMGIMIPKLQTNKHEPKETVQGAVASLNKVLVKYVQIHNKNHRGSVEAHKDLPDSM
jgi:hypothetical protein